ncbi:MAG: biotin--[acetyl-CoA-carboxylase] ligase [Bacillales bacterium]|nr:biotin--[acetyl-CoA-carboxylase] ligase [Bacillales bacterium]
MNKLIEFESLDSTNEYGKNNIGKLNNLDIIFTKHQTNGHGRIKRQWQSDENSLTFSLIIKDKYLIDNYSSLSLISAVSVFNIISKYLNNVSIKWPNDIYVNNKKICGILLESLSYEDIIGIIIGIGINVNNSNFDSAINATSLYIESSKKYCIKDILNEVVDSLKEEIIKFKNHTSNYLQVINENNYLLGKKAYATINDKKQLVTIGKILDNDSLEVYIENMTLQVRTDEISFKQ